MKVLTITITHANSQRYQMRFIRSLYNWTMKLAGNPRAIWFLGGFVSFIEAIFFPILPDILLIPMILANKKSVALCLCCNNYVCFGRISGLRYRFCRLRTNSRTVTFNSGKQSAMDIFSNSINENGFLIVLTAGVSPIPFKVVAIMSGFTQMPIYVFLYQHYWEEPLDFLLLQLY